MKSHRFRDYNTVYHKIALIEFNVDGGNIIKPQEISTVIELLTFPQVVKREHNFRDTEIKKKECYSYSCLAGNQK